MKAIVCEMCSGHDFVKQDGMFVCQSCGTKYTIDDAKKLMVDVSGSTVKLDTSEELKNLYVLARRAKADNNTENAQKYYSQIMIKDPSSWEAYFYDTYYQTMNCKIGEIGVAAERITNCEESVFNLLKDNVTDLDEREKAVYEVAERLTSISSLLFNAYKNHYDGIGAEIRSNYTQEYLDNCSAARDILYTGGDLIVKIFGDEYGWLAAKCWKLGVREHKELLPKFAHKIVNADIIKSYNEKISKYEPDYQPSVVNKNSEGCYVATAVYGSYDCPQVWTLRRYRDDTLAATWYGRAFIHTYYAISPTLVKWFGKTEWFKNLWKPKLDRMVEKLRQEGVEDTPYQDRDW